MSEACAFICGACIRYSYGLYVHGTLRHLSQPGFLALPPFSALSLIFLLLCCNFAQSFSEHLHFVQSVIFLFPRRFSSPLSSPFLSLSISVFSALTSVPLIFSPLSFPHLNPFCPLFSLSLPPPRFGPVLPYALCHFARCVNGFLFPHPTALSSLRSSVGVLLICVLC